MRVALVYLGRKGGGPVYSLEIAKRLKEKVNLFCVVSSQIENFEFWQRNNLNIYSIDTYNNFLSFFISLLNFKKFFCFYKIIKNFNPDVIYYPFFFYWLPIVNFLFPKIPKVYTVHDVILHKGEKSLLMDIIQKKTIKKSKRVIILANIFKENIVALGKKGEDVDIIPHGIFDYYFKNFSQEKILHPPTILFFGRILKYKGLEIILKAFPLIKKEIPNCRLLIVGKGNLKPYEKFLQKKISDIIIENKWIEEKELAKYFLQSDILVCPYLEASQSGVIPIAYAAKMPVVATRVGGLIEQVDNGITGFLVEPKDYLSLAQKIIFLLKNKKEMQLMGENGFLKAQKEWNWDIIAEKILDSLRKTININK